MHLHFNREHIFKPPMLHICRIYENEVNQEVKLNFNVGQNTTTDCCFKLWFFLKCTIVHAHKYIT